MDKISRHLSIPSFKKSVTFKTKTYAKISSKFFYFERDVRNRFRRGYVQNETQNTCSVFANIFVALHVTAWPKRVFNSSSVSRFLLTLL